MDQFYLAYKETALHADEIVTGLEIPKSEGEFFLYKICNRKDLDISVVTFAMHAKRQGKVLSNVKFALGGVGPVVKRYTDVEKLIEGRTWSTELFDAAAEKAVSLIKPLSDLRASSEYRSLVVKNFWKKMSRDLGAR
jgi:xanthine dehydrogenase small subunit